MCTAGNLDGQAALVIVYFGRAEGEFFKKGEVWVMHCWLKAWRIPKCGILHCVLWGNFLSVLHHKCITFLDEVVHAILIVHHRSFFSLLSANLLCHAYISLLQPVHTLSNSKSIFSAPRQLENAPRLQNRCQYFA